MFQKIIEKAKKYQDMGIAAAACAAAYFLLQDLTVGSVFNPFMALYNLFLLFTLCAFLSFIGGSIRMGIAGICLFSCLVTLTNQFLLEVRGQILQPADFTAIRTAILVAGNYSLVPTKEMAGAFFLFVFLLYTAWKHCGDKDVKISGKRRMAAAGISLAACLSLISLPLLTDTLPLYLPSFNHTFGAAYNGTFAYFLAQCREMKTQETEPEGYDEEKAENILSAYEDAGTETTGKKTPNIIAIMCESFSDPAVLGDFTCNEDYIPYIRSLMEEGENTVSGTIYVSAIGGGTANTEYEFLSGNSMVFFANGVYPYEQYLNAESDTSYMLPETLNHLGYRTVAMHPFDGSGYNRNRVYPAMKFDEIYFEEDFDDPEYVRDFISDQCLFEKIVKEYEETKGEEPFFCFAVTMQNHGFYSDSSPEKQAMEEKGARYGSTFSFDGSIQVEGEDDESLETYLSLERLTDDAVKFFVEYFDSQEEDTVILFFGDHQPAPSVTAPITEEGDLSRYCEVPFFFHANFDIEEKRNVETSANYLMSYLSDFCGIPDTAYGRFLKYIRGYAPVLSKVFEKQMGDEEVLREYEWVQYYLVHRKKKG